MKKRPLVSVVIVCLNSEKTIGKTLQSISYQNYPKSFLEVLVIDGGSTDRTIDIVKSYGYNIVKNKQKGFVEGKYIGFRRAKGEYLLYIDSDEEMRSKQSISKKVNCFLSDFEIKAIMSTGYKSPKKFNFINQYLSEYGDPFAFFVYRISKSPDLFVKSMKKKYPNFTDTPNFTSFQYSKDEELPLLEFVALASMIDLKYMKKIYKSEKNSQIPHFFYKIVEDGKKIAITKRDVIYHYSSSTLSNFLKKISWRIYKNVFEKNASDAGFIGRNKYQNGVSKYKKYLFIPYSFSLIIPLIDSLKLVYEHKYNWKFLIHFPLTIYTAIFICYYYSLKATGITPADKIYGK